MKQILNNNFFAFLDMFDDMIIILEKSSWKIKYINSKASEFYNINQKLATKFFPNYAKKINFPYTQSQFQNSYKLLSDFDYCQHIEEEETTTDIRWSVACVQQNPFSSNPILLLRGQDISYHRKIAELDATLKSVVDNAPVSIYWKNKKGRYLGFNNYVLKMAGLNEKKDLLNKTDDELPWKRNAKKVSRVDKKVIETGETYHLEETGKLANGNVHTYIASKTPIKDKAGRILGLVGFSFDITDRKKMEEQLKVAMKKAQEANLIKAQFIENMEHDLRTPCLGIATLAEMLAQKESDSKKHEDLLMIAEAGRQLLKLFNTILDFDFIDSKGLPIIREKFDLHQLITRVINLEKPPAKSRNLAMSCEIADNVPQYVLGDHFRLSRILINLLSNALKFTFQGSVKVRISMKPKSANNQLELFEFKVSDTGIGISENKLSFIFEKFSRLSSSNRGVYTGAGLGLRIVKQFVEELKGKIKVESKLKKGSIFTVTIPLMLAKTPRSNQPPKGNKKTTTKKPAKNSLQSRLKASGIPYKALLVEDNKMAQHIETHLLSSEFGITAEIAETGQNAIDLSIGNNFDIILMDVGLPDMTGFSAAEKILKHNKDTIIVALTAHSAQSILQEAKSVGMKDVITKPLNVSKITKLFNKYLVIKK